jgi:broad specificity phosphatase PhoE
MNPYTLTLLRHGEIDHQGCLTGQREAVLTQAGGLVMESSWRRLQALASVSTMATSPLLRCREFAVRHALEISVPLKVDPRFSEFDFGLWDGEPLEALNRQQPEWKKQLRAGQIRLPEGESQEVFHTRVLTGFSEWIASTRGSHRLLVTHGAVITILLAELLGMDTAVARLMTVQAGGFIQLSILEDHPAYLMHLELPQGE